MNSRLVTGILVLITLLLLYAGWRTAFPGTGQKAGQSAGLLKENTDKIGNRKRALSGNQESAIPATKSKEETETKGIIETVVSEGETVYTQGYESAPGFFAFSRVTPKFWDESNGEPIVELNFETTEMSIVGGSKTLVERTVGVRPGKDLTFHMVGEEGIHELVVEIGKESSSTEIAMRIYNGYQPYKLAQ